MEASASSYPTGTMGMEAPESQPSPITHQVDIDSYPKPRLLSLDDLPTELIDEITKYLRLD